MNLGISTLFALSRPLEEAIEEIELLDVPLVEVTDEGAHALSRSRVRLLNELRSSNGWEFSAHAPFSDVNIAACDSDLRRAILKRLKKSMGYAAEIDAKVWVFHPGATTALEWFYPGRSWKLNLESVKGLWETAEDTGVAMAIENVPDPFPFLMKSVEDFERFYNDFGYEMGMVLDVAHANIRRETLRFLDRLGSRIVHVHVSDNMADQDTHLQIGLGNIRWAEVLEGLKSIGFKGSIVVESNQGVSESLRLLKEMIN